MFLEYLDKLKVAISVEYCKWGGRPIREAYSPQLFLEASGANRTILPAMRFASRSSMVWKITSIIIFGVVMVRAAEEGVPRGEPASVTEAIESLGGEDYSFRERATRWLWYHAGQALSELKAASDDDNDQERQWRALRILEAFEMGILPDTPQEIVKRIYEFRDGTLQQKQSIIQNLVAEGKLDAAHQLIRSVEDGVVKAQLVQLIATQVRTQLLPMLIAGKHDEAQKLLERYALDDRGMRDLAAFLHLTGREMDAEALPAAPREPWKVHAWRHRAVGNMDAAIQLGEEHQNPLWVLATKAAAGDTQAFCESQLLDPNIVPLRKHGFEAILARLRGDQDRLAKSIQEIVDWANDETNPYNRRQAMDLLVLNDAIDEVPALLDKDPDQTVYDVETFRGRYGKALEAIGVKQDRPPYSPWIEERCQEIKEGKDGVFKMAAEFAKRVHGMGDEEEAHRLFGLIFEALENDSDQKWSLVTEAAVAGDKEFVRERLKNLETPQMRPEQLSQVIPIRQSLIRQWWDFFAKRDTDKHRVDTLMDAWAFLDLQDNEEKPRPGVEDLLREAYAASGAIRASQRAEHRHVIYFTAHVHGLLDLAFEYLEGLVRDTPKPDWVLSLAGLCMEREDYENAARYYEQSWQLNLNAARVSQASGAGTSRTALRPHYLYLSAIANKKAGNTFTEQALKLASLLCLGDLEARHQLAVSMNQQGEKEQATKEWELVTRLSQPEDTQAPYAFLNLAKHASKSDPAKAVALQERAAAARHYILVRYGSPINYDIRLRSEIHAWSVEAALAENDQERALAALEAYWQLTPGNASIGERLLPLAEEHGLTQEAKEYYSKTRALALEACKRFPKSAMAHNNLAWLDARSRRRLEDALDHANTAVALRPNTAAYIDTLAEVYFAMGDRETALKHSNFAVTLTPDDEELIGQNERFKSAPLPKKRD